MKRAFKGLSTRSMLVATMGLLITSITLSSLLVVRNRLQHQVFDELSGDLLRSVETFRAADAQRLSALRRENALLADLPSLRALMTTADRRTIADGAVRFWKVSGSDLFALADRDGQLVTMYTRGAPPGAELQGHLAQAMDQEDKHLLLGDGRLFQYSRQPLFFGSEENGTLLGYVVSGYAVTSELVRQINDSSGADVAFRSRSRVVTSTLPTRWWPALERWSSQALAQAGRPVTITVGEQRYLTSSTDLSPDASEPLELLVMKSFDRADRARHELNRLLLLVGACALCAGTLLMVVISASSRLRWSA